MPVASSTATFGFLTSSWDPCAETSSSKQFLTLLTTALLRVLIYLVDGIDPRLKPQDLFRFLEQTYKAWQITDDRTSSFMCGKSADKETRGPGGADSERKGDATQSLGENPALWPLIPSPRFFFFASVAKSAFCLRVDRRFYGPRSGRVCCRPMHDRLAIESFPMM